MLKRWNAGKLGMRAKNMRLPLGREPFGSEFKVELLEAERFPPLSRDSQ
jgi:hypothetical protein